MRDILGYAHGGNKTSNNKVEICIKSYASTCRDIENNIVDVRGVVQDVKEATHP